MLVFIDESAYPRFFREVAESSYMYEVAFARKRGFADWPGWVIVSTTD
jgi:hypothetical protein